MSVCLLTSLAEFRRRTRGGSYAAHISSRILICSSVLPLAYQLPAKQQPFFMAAGGAGYDE